MREKTKLSQCKMCGKNYEFANTSMCRSCRAVIGHRNRISKNKELYDQVLEAILSCGTKTDDLDIKIASEMIVGSILGDGYIIRTKYENKLYHNYGFSRKSISEEYTTFLANHINKVLLRTGGIGENDEKIIDILGINCMCQKQYVYSFLNKYIFKKIRKKWYDKNRVKRVPRDTILSPMICKIWYIDDGCLGKPDSILLSTQCFSVSDVLFLITLLKKTGLTSVHRRVDKTGKSVIGIEGDSVYKFLNYIGSCPVVYYEYKWNLQGWKINEQICPYCKNKFTYYSGKEYRVTCGRKLCSSTRHRETRRIYYEKNKKAVLEQCRLYRLRIKGENSCK